MIIRCYFIFDFVQKMAKNFHEKTRMTTTINSKAHKYLDWQTDEVTRRVDKKITSLTLIEAD